MVYSGIDISKDTFTASFMRSLPHFLLIGKDYDQSRFGFQEYLKDIRSFQDRLDPVTICIENTGVYQEKLCYYIYNKKHVTLYVEAPQHVKRAFGLKGKTDKADSKQITEYAIRYHDKLIKKGAWSPPPEVVEDIRQLIRSREILKKQQKMNKNVIASTKHKYKASKALVVCHQDVVDLTEEHIRDIEKQMKEALTWGGDQAFSAHVQHLLTIKCIGLHCVCGFLSITNGFQRYDYLKLAGLLGLAPRPFTSGTSVKKKDKSDRHGYGYLRKNLNLAAKSACNHSEDFRDYYRRMKARGKDEKLIYNNVSYKLLKRMCMVIRENRPYYKEYTPIPPIPQKRS